MMSAISRFKRMISVVALITMLSMSGCGYFMYPERVGQTGGKIDPAIVVLDAIGLLVGIVPGVIAFAVDITTGAIYLAPGEKSAIEKHKQRASLGDVSHSIPTNYTEVSPIDVPVNAQAIADKLSSVLILPIDAKDIKFYRIADNKEFALIETGIRIN